MQILDGTRLHRLFFFNRAASKCTHLISMLYRRAFRMEIDKWLDKGFGRQGCLFIGLKTSYHFNDRGGGVLFQDMAGLAMQCFE